MATTINLDYTSVLFPSNLNQAIDENRIALRGLAYWLNKTKEGQVARAWFMTGRRVKALPPVTWDPTTVEEFAEEESGFVLDLVRLFDGAEESDLVTGANNFSTGAAPDNNALLKAIEGARYVNPKDWENLFEQQNLAPTFQNYCFELLSIFFKRPENKKLHAVVFGMKPTSTITSPVTYILDNTWDGI